MIFTTGAFLKPRKQVVDGKTFWFWAVESFEDESFINGQLCNPQEYIEEVNPYDKQALLSFYDD